MPTPLVMGNWKMNGGLAANTRWVEGFLPQVADLQSIRIAICSPFPYLQQLSELLADSEVALGAQNVSEHESGAYTGEVAVSMLRDFNCHYVLVGHSERRSLYGETDAVVAAKFETVMKAGLVPVLCVGETLEERQAERTEAVVAEQLDAVLDKVGIAGLRQAVIAYEPVWAIGTGQTATPEQAQSVHAFIRQKLAALDADIAQALPLLYGGSVKADNAGTLFAQADIDGGLVGGASLDPDTFAQICRAAS